MKNKAQFKINQVFKSKKWNFQIIISGKRGGKWLCRTLTEKPGVFADSHRMSEYTIKKRFDLIKA